MKEEKKNGYQSPQYLVSSHEDTKSNWENTTHNSNFDDSGSTSEVWKKNTSMVKGKDYNLLDCKQCGYSSSDKSNLRRHIKSVHKKIKNYECEKCENAFSQKVHLEKHIKTKHN